MTRMNIMDGEGTDFAGPAVIGWFDSDKAEWWDDADHNGNGSGGTGRGEGVWRTKAGKWVFCRWSNWQGEKTVCTYMDAEAAREWLLKNEFDATVEMYFGEVAEEEDRRPGRPEIGGRVTLSLGPDLLARIDAWAEERGISRAEAVRQRLEASFGSAATQTLEFSYKGGTIGGAQDIVRQATPAGEAAPSVQQAGRLGFTVTAGGDVIDRLRAELEDRGEECYVTEA